MQVVKDIPCPNTECPEFGKLDGVNVYVRRAYARGEIRFLNCRVCRLQFSERQGTPLFDLRLPKEKIIAVVKHLAEGTGVRKTARLTAVSRDSVGRILKRVGKQAKAIHDHLVRNLKVPEVQMDEMWSFVKKKTRTSRLRNKKPGKKAVSGTIWPSTRGPS